MTTVILAIGLVLCVEGLVFALVPRRVEDALRLLAEMPPETRRLMGLTALAIGVLLIWLARNAV